MTTTTTGPGPRCRQVSPELTLHYWTDTTRGAPCQCGRCPLPPLAPRTTNPTGDPR